MPGPAAGGLPPDLTREIGPAGSIAVGPVLLLGVPVIAVARPSTAEHGRRLVAGVGPVTDPALLGRLLDLPAGQPVRDPVVWAETSGLPAGLVARAGDGYTVTRLLEPPLVLDGIVVQAGRADDLQAIQKASLFASFTWRWVSCRRTAVPVTTVLEAKVFGVGLLAPGGRVVLQAEPPLHRTVDGWAWLLQEKTYRCWRRANP